MKRELGTHNLTTIPASVPTNPGVSAPDIEFSATLADGKQIHVVALLTDNVNKGLQDPTFRTRYETLSTRADFIVYNGHAGLGSNIRALASAGKWVAGQYVVVFMNGCDTFAYIDGSLFSAHKAVNLDDVTGDKYADIVNNGERVLRVDGKPRWRCSAVGGRSPKTYGRSSRTSMTRSS